VPVARWAVDATVSLAKVNHTVIGLTTAPRTGAIAVWQGSLCRAAVVEALGVCERASLDTNPRPNWLPVAWCESWCEML